MKEDIIEKYLYNSTRNIYLAGAAGTGKTTIMQKYIETHPNTIVCAPTGVAAVNIGGDTMHKVFSIPVPAYGAQIGKVTASKLKPLILADCVIIDEISMARNDVFSFAIKVLRKAERLKGKPIRLIVVGDFAQLPPVVQKTDEKMLKKFGFDTSGLAFTTSEWKTMNFKVIELSEIKRQTDKEFLEHLWETRQADGECIPYFNSFVRNDYPKDAIRICGTNAEADRINKEYLDSLEGNTVAYQAEKTGRCVGTSIDDIVLLKPGAKVMFTTNDVVDAKYSNGTFGTIKNCYDKCVDVITEYNEEIRVFFHEYKLYSYKTTNNVLTKTEIGCIKQIPLKIAKAITIHKSQGKTFEQAVISPQIFAPGQLYVALSRIRTPEGLYLTEPIDENCLKQNEMVKQFIISGYEPITYQGKASLTKTITKKKTTIKKPASKTSSKKSAVKKSTAKKSATKTTKTAKKKTINKPSTKKTATSKKTTNKRKTVTKKKTTKI